MVTPLIALFARLAVPERLQRPLAYLTGAIAAVALLWLLKGCYDRSVIRNHETAITAQVQTKAAAANANAAGAVSDTRNAVQKGNDDARKAASAGTDPLGDGFRSLRAEAGADSAATRRPDDLR